MKGQMVGGGMRASVRRRVFGWPLTALTIVGAVVVVLPYLWMVSSSLKPQDAIFRLPPEWIPRPPQWSNYPTALARFPFGTYFFNSAVVALAVMASNVFFGSLAAYGLAKFRFPWREVCFRAILSTLMLPLEILLVPTFLVVRQLGLLDSYGGLIFPLAVDAFGIFLMRQYMLSIPDALIEAARLDGCGEFGIFWRIVLPNSRPALAAMAVLSFRENWDQFLWPLVMISKESLKTFPLGLAQFEGFFNASYHEMMAAAVVGMIPMILLFLVFQRAFVRGITLTGLKE
jgi:multiple sugar transport system permease protein